MHRHTHSLHARKHTEQRLVCCAERVCIASISLAPLHPQSRDWRLHLGLLSVKASSLLSFSTIMSFLSLSAYFLCLTLLSMSLLYMSILSVCPLSVSPLYANGRWERDRMREMVCVVAKQRLITKSPSMCYPALPLGRTIWLAPLLSNQTWTLRA